MTGFEEKKRFSHKKALAWIFMLSALGMGWLSFFYKNPNDFIALLGLFLGTGLTLFGIRTAGGVAIQRGKDKI